MTLPAPNLDDRRFQDLVDDAKRLVQQRCPEWTDHNVSDPGVTMIELFASMVDQLLYRLNRVPDRHYVKFLELIGVRLLPPNSADTEVTFWLSAPQQTVLEVPVGTEVATMRTEVEEAVTFSVVEDLPIVASSLLRVGTSKSSAAKTAKVIDHTEALESGQGFSCFDKAPTPGDALLIGLSEAVPRCAVLLRISCRIEGVGVDPTNPPIVWEAWDGAAWSRCEVDRDGTGGLNRDGDIVLHVPRSHIASVVGGQRAGWLRCRVVEPEGRPEYSSSPRITRMSACTVGGTTRVDHSDLVTDEIIGLSEGVPGQRFLLKRQPVVPSEHPAVLEVAGGAGWEEWTRVDSFAESGPNDTHFLLDEMAGEVVLGPGVREPDGSLRLYGAVPPKGTPLRVPAYRTGGGRRGNVARGTIAVLKSSIPYVSRVENRIQATRGVDAEDIEAAKVRGPLLLRTGNRAVTAEDYEHLARQAAPDVARVRCVSAGDETDPGAVRVLVVPAIPDDPRGRLRFEELIPSDSLLMRIADYLAERKVIGARLIVEPPVYQSITVVARIRARSRTNVKALQSDALDALYRYFHPVFGGPDGKGWPFGRPVHSGEVYSVLQRLRGMEFVEDVKLFGADPITGQRGEMVARIDLGSNALVFSYEHQLRVQEA